MTSGAFEQSHYTAATESSTVLEVCAFEKALVRLVAIAPYLIAFCIPIRLSWTYAALLPSLLAWLYLRRSTLIDQVTAVSRHPLVWPMVIFWSYCFLSGLFGLHPLESLRQITKIFFYMLLIPLVADPGFSRSPAKILMCLMAAHAITGFHSLLASAFPESIPSMFVGTLTESGQLSISIILAAGMLFATRVTSDTGFTRFVPAAGLVFISLCLLAFHSAIELPQLIAPIIAIVAAIGLLLLSAFGLRSSYPRLILITLIFLPLMSAALLANLKRGPWIGVCCGMLIVCFYYARRFLIPALLLIPAISLGVEPVFSRLSQSVEHFFISGGRSSIWNVGLDLCTRFPLGIGYANSDVLQQYDPSIPAELQHFHSNFLNILVETGWPGLMIFLWWICRFIAAGFSAPRVKPEEILLQSICIALFSLQVAGIVEYNMGDSEILLLVFLVLGLFVLMDRERSETGAEALAEG